MVYQSDNETMVIFKSISYILEESKSCITSLRRLRSKEKKKIPLQTVRYDFNMCKNVPIYIVPCDVKCHILSLKHKTQT